MSANPRAELLRLEKMTIRTLTHSTLRGFMMPHLMNGPLINAAVGIEAEKAGEWVMERLLR